MSNTNCYVDPARPRKTEMLCGSFAAGCNGNVIYLPRRQAIRIAPAEHHVIWGQRHASLQVIPRVRRREGQHMWQIDNGWFDPGCGSRRGYYRLTVDQPGPRYMEGFGLDRVRMLDIRPRVWQRGGKHVLLCLPGDYFGRPWGISMEAWTRDIMDRIKQKTDRPVLVRDKVCERSLQEDLKDAWCVVTHSSAAAVHAAVSGVPVFCEETCASVPVSRTDLEIEEPIYPDREMWLASLVHQQFTVNEFRSGFAWETMQKVLML